jgi:hypothetical protein
MSAITIGGRVFTPLLVSTIEHDLWLMSHIQKAGLDTLRKLSEETMDVFVLRILREVIDSGRVFELLGGMLVPENVAPEAWTPAMAIETADFIRHLTDLEDKRIVQAQVVSLLIGFFENGLTSLITSPSSLAGKENQPVSRIEAH